MHVGILKNYFVAMQPYTPHGDSNPVIGTQKHLPFAGMQPYTPHGDSNCTTQLSR